MHTALTSAMTSPILAFGGPGPRDGGGGWHGGPFFLFIPLFWLAVLVVAIVVIARGRRRWHEQHRADAEQHRRDEADRRADEALRPLRRAELTLSERYARGDIEESEYRARLEVLRASAGLVERG